MTFWEKSDTIIHMKKMNTAPISGTEELLPALQAKFDSLLNEIRKVYRAHGFQHIETPVIERTEILLAKAGGETEKQIYKVVKTAETADEADQALRFDHTVPLARYVVQHLNDLSFPFKVTQVGRNFRGERAQRGRFREFYQCDIDVIGRGELAIAYDAEIIATAIDALQTLPLPNIQVRISNRKIIRGLLAELLLENSDLSAKVISIIDHAEKVSSEETHSALLDLGIDAKEVTKIEDFIAIRGARAETIGKLRELGIDNEVFAAGVQELDEILRELETRGLGNQVVSDMVIVRGLDYYTGMVFETIVPEYREIGSICSGGRYENLAENYTDIALPGVGGSIGLTRLFWIMQNYELIHIAELCAIEVAIIPVSELDAMAAEQLARDLRNEGHVVDVVRGGKNLARKMKYASKNAQEVVVVGEKESRSGKYQIKNMLTGETVDLAQWRSQKF